MGTTACDAATGFDGPSGVGAPKGLGAFKSNAVTFLTQTSATLNGRVNPDGQNVTECEFEYGTSTSYGSKAPCKSLPGSESSPVAVSASIAAGLVANTEYHFRPAPATTGIRSTTDRLWNRRGRHPEAPAAKKSFGPPYS